MSAAEVGTLEDQLTVDAEDLDARARLLEFYFVTGDLGEWLRHEVWLVEHHPGSDLHRVVAGLKAEWVERLALAWRKAVADPAASMEALRNAARFYAGVDERTSQELFARASRWATGSGRAPKRISVGSGVREAVLLEKVQPVYPPAALRGRIEGVVKFTAMIGVNGRLSEISLVSGPALLVPAAMDVVKQWRYTPTMLRGEAVAVRTVVEVPFVLPR